MSKKEQSADKPKRIYYYYCCKGTHEDDGSGGRRCICKGHIFTLESRLGYCPACGKPLGMLTSEKELPEAVTCPMEKCLTCKYRQQSVAVNDEHCLGGSRQKDGKIQNVTGSQLCNGCLCKECCHEIIEDANAIKKYGISAVIKAQVTLRDYARQVVRHGIVSNENEMEKLYFETRSNNPVLSDIRPETCERWALDAIHALEKETADEGKENKAEAENE